VAVGEPVALLPGVKTLAVFPVDEAIAVVCAVALLPTLVVNEPVAEDPLCPVPLEYSVEPVPVVPELGNIVVCVIPVVPEIRKRKTFIP